MIMIMRLILILMDAVLDHDASDHDYVDMLIRWIAKILTSMMRNADDDG